MNRIQRPRARKSHLVAMEAGNTCIDCHKGIAHKSVRDRVPAAELETIEAPRRICPPGSGFLLSPG
ncbi:MAG: NapC/NirT family cytochrome c [Alphaproteobacteria bacterium]